MALDTVPRTHVVSFRWSPASVHAMQLNADDDACDDVAIFGVAVLIGRAASAEVATDAGVNVGYGVYVGNGVYVAWGVGVGAGDVQLTRTIANTTSRIQRFIFASKQSAL